MTLPKKNFRSLEITAKTLINNFGTGSHISSLKDSIIDVDITREYQPGDRKLDSRSSLKTSRSMSRVFNPDKLMTLFLVLDLSPSQFSKLENSLVACLYLTYLAEISNDAVGLLTFSDRVQHLVMPSQDYQATKAALERSYSRDLVGQTNIEEVLKKVEALELNNSMIVIVSDFCYDLSHRTLCSLRRIAGGHNNCVLSLIMCNEKEWGLEPMPFSLNILDSESGEAMSLNCKNTNSRALKDWKDCLKTSLRQARSTPVFVEVNQDNYLMRLVEFFLRG